MVNLWQIVFTILLSPNFAKARKLILTEVSGFMLRKNALYISPDANSKEYRVSCSTPSESTCTGLKWVNITDGAPFLFVEGAGNNVTLSIKPNEAFPTFLQYNCSCLDKDTTLESTTLTVYKTAADMLIEGYEHSVVDMANISLSCKERNTATKVRWYRDEVEIIEGDKEKAKLFDGNGTIMLNAADAKDSGMLMCRSTTSPNRLAFFNITGAPFIPLKHGSRLVSIDSGEGLTVKISYEILGNPVDPSNIIWKRTIDGDKNETIDDKFFEKYPTYKGRLVFNPTPDGANGELELKNLVKADRAVFTMFVTNSFGDTSFSTLVRVKGKLDALWPFLGILIEVALLVIIIFFYERKRAKQDRDDDDDGPAKKSLTTSVNENEDNIRMRKL